MTLFPILVNFLLLVVPSAETVATLVCNCEVKCKPFVTLDNQSATFSSFTFFSAVLSPCKWVMDEQGQYDPVSHSCDIKLPFACCVFYRKGSSTWSASLK